MSDSTVTPEASTLPWDSLRHPIWLFDPETCRGLYANPPAMALWDAETLDELLARDFSKLSPAVRTRTERLARATADGQAVTERWTFYPKGNPVTVQAVISNYPMPGGRSVLLFEATPIQVEDGERRAVEALRHTSSLITLFTSEGVPIFANPAAVAVYGDGADFCARFADRAYAEGVLNSVRTGQVISELVEVASLGRARSHHIDARQVLDPVTGGVSILLSERDVTAQVEAERALLLAEERAAVAVAKEQFLSNVSHELRTPLTSVLGYASLLMSETGLSPEAGLRVGKIKEAGETLLEIVNNVIALGELEKGGLAPEIVGFCLQDSLRGLLEEIAPRAARKGLTLRLAVDPDMPQHLIGDPGKILGVLRHFATNAVKFTNAGGIVVGAALHELTAQEAQIALYVRDTGPGVAPEDRERIFDRFSQINEGRSRVGGTGLGLAIAAALAKTLGGEIGVTAAPSGGALFYLNLELPLSGSAASPSDADLAEERSESLSILYADDHENNRLLVSAILTKQGHACDLVEDGLQALEAVRRKPYDVVLMDIQMPVMDGVTAAREIRRLDSLSALPILALTANTQSAELQEYAAAGMNDCIAKPVRVPELMTKIERWSRAAAPKPDAASATG